MRLCVGCYISFLCKSFFDSLGMIERAPSWRITSLEICEPSDQSNLGYFGSHYLLDSSDNDQPRTSERGVNLESLLMDLSRTQSVTNQPMAIPGTNAVGYQWMDLPPTHVLITACLRLPDWLPNFTLRAPSLLNLIIHCVSILNVDSPGLLGTRFRTIRWQEGRREFLCSVLFSDRWQEASDSNHLNLMRQAGNKWNHLHAMPLGASKMDKPPTKDRQGLDW